MGTVNQTRAVATISPAQLEETITVLHGRLAEVEGQPNRYCVPRALAATTVERRQLSAACAHLEARLEPCHDKLLIEAVISQFLIPYDTARESDAVSTETRNERFVNAVLGQPLGAIQAAVERFDSASTILPVSVSFRPKPAEFAAEVKAGLTSLRKKLVHVRRILAAEVYDPPTAEQRAEVEKARQAAAEYLTRRMPQADARPVLAEPEEGPRTGSDIVAPLKGLDVSHLMANLDRKRVLA
ncbi:hypothetical protein [Methylobacterium goesingense]|uniref:Uncharacterized protein n=1 Tax=Methylobacterium goesingense TaxID=243690 RepID=A0ABV2L1H3_9HYPH|nr:hypothetical protein [Methylobacterium goesingense]GJD72579.1 hypothetical protein CFIICLFH_0796 [Methylobacterium goesingense]